MPMVDAELQQKFWGRVLIIKSIVYLICFIVLGVAVWWLFR